MDEGWEREVRGSAPSFQEFLAAEHAERERFLESYMASRAIPDIATNRQSLESFLEHAGCTLAASRGEAERLLDAFVRVRPERLARPAWGGPSGRLA